MSSVRRPAAASTLVADDTNGWSDVFVYHTSERPLPPFNLSVETMVGNRVTLRWFIPGSGVQPSGFLLEGGLVA